MGRYYGLGRDLIEETARLTIDDLKTWGLLHEGINRGILTLKRRKQTTGSRGIEVHIKDPQSYIEFEYLLNKSPVAYEHEIELFPCNFGGYRFYFWCRNCGRRITALYFSEGYYSCRHCLGLVYLVSREHRSIFEKIDRANYLKDKADRLKKHGHPRKANKLYFKADYLKSLSWQDAKVWLDKTAKK